MTDSKSGTPAWKHNGTVCVMAVLKDKVKLTLQDGASLPDPQRLFNAGLGGNRWRAIDIYEGDRLNERGIRALIGAGVKHNSAKAKPAAKPRWKAARSR